MTDHEPQNASDDASAEAHVFKIQIDREHYKVNQQGMTGAALRKVPPTPIPADRDLFEVVPGHPDLKIENETIVKIRDGERFFTAPGHINPGCAFA